MRQEDPKALNVNRVIIQSLFNEGGTLSEEDTDEIERVLSFKANGAHAVSNAGGYLVELSSCGDSARLEINEKGSKHYVLTDWLEIEFIIDEDSEEDEEGHKESEPVIDPDGYNVPLSLVMILNH